jgi:hypothetical protein
MSIAGKQVIKANDNATNLNMATGKVLGRTTALSGSVQEITTTTFGFSMLGAADAAAGRTVLGLGSAATTASTAYAAAVHNHLPSNITMSGPSIVGRTGGLSGNATSITFDASLALTADVLGVKTSAYAITYAATVTLSLANGLSQAITLTGTCVMTLPSGTANGQYLDLCVTEDGTGGRTFSFAGTNWAVASTVPDTTITTTANAANYFTLRWHAGLAKWHFLGKAVA